MSVSYLVVVRMYADQTLAERWARKLYAKEGQNPRIVLLGACRRPWAVALPRDEVREEPTV
jgi:hypothetical protein